MKLILCAYTLTTNDNGVHWIKREHYLNVYLIHFIHIIPMHKSVVVVKILNIFENILGQWQHCHRPVFLLLLWLFSLSSMTIISLVVFGAIWIVDGRYDGRYLSRKWRIIDVWEGGLDEHFHTSNIHPKNGHLIKQ